MQSFARALGAKEPSVRSILQSATAQDAHGFTLARLEEIARQHGLQVQAAVRAPGSQWLLPAVVHCREDLWRTVVAPYRTGFWVQDPSRGRFWISADALEDEASGFCLVPRGILPSGWRLASAAETTAPLLAAASPRTRRTPRTNSVHRLRHAVQQDKAEEQEEAPAQVVGEAEAEVEAEQEAMPT